MNDCQFKDQIINYIEGLMDIESRAIFEKHLKECPACQKELLAVKKVYEIIDKDEVIVPPKEFFEQLKDNVRRKEIVIKRPFWKIIGVLAPVLGVLVFVLFFIQGKEQSVEMTISVSNISQDEYLNTLLLERIIDNDIADQFNQLEEYLELDVEQSVRNLTADEKEIFLKLISIKYSEEYL